MLGILAAAAVAGRRTLLKDRRFWLGLGTGAALAALHPACGALRPAMSARLAFPGDARWVTAREYLTALADPNVGLLPQVPIFAAAVLGGVLLLAWRAPWHLASPGVVAAVTSGAWLAFIAAMATNVNHGGTPGLSRYATWFAPLALPLFQEIDHVMGRRVAWMALPAVVSAALGVFSIRSARTWMRAASLLGSFMASSFH